MGDAANVIIGAAIIAFDGTDLGFTKDGIKIRMEREYVDVAADQLVGLVKKGKAMEKVFVSTTLLETTLANIVVAWDQPTGSFGSTSVQEKALEIIGPAPGGTTRTISLYRTVQTADGELSYSREEEASLEVEFEALKRASDQQFGTIAES